MTFDSRPETIDHINAVRRFMRLMIDKLRMRAVHHDKSKLETPEKEGFDIFTPRLRELTYNSPAYLESLAEMDAILVHHYANNTHHPQHYKLWRCPVCETVFQDDAAPIDIRFVQEIRLCPKCCKHGTIMECALEPAGVYGMDLLDIFEMLADWKAATYRHRDGDIRVSLEQNRKRFGLSDQLYQILLNTVERMEWTVATPAPATPETKE